MCIKKEDRLKMPIQNGMVMKKKPKIVIASKPVSSGKKRLISPNHLGRLAVDSLITSPVKSEPKEIKEDTKVRAGTNTEVCLHQLWSHPHLKTFLEAAFLTVCPCGAVDLAGLVSPDTAVVPHDAPPEESPAGVATNGSVVLVSSCCSPTDEALRAEVCLPGLPSAPPCRHHLALLVLHHHSVVLLPVLVQITRVPSPVLLRVAGGGNRHEHCVLLGQL